MGLAEQDYMSSEALADIPDESVVDTESSDGWGLGFEDESNGDHENDKDYVMDSDEGDKGLDLDSEREIYLCEVWEAVKKPGKAKVTEVSVGIFGLCKYQTRLSISFILSSFHHKIT